MPVFFSLHIFSPYSIVTRSIRFQLGFCVWSIWTSSLIGRILICSQFKVLLAMHMEMATHSSVLAWRIPGTGEPGGLPSMGSHRLRHDWSDLAVAAAWLSDKANEEDTRDMDLIPGLGRSLGEENGNSL